MAMTDEEVGEAVKACVEAWTRAKALAGEVGDATARAAYERVSTDLLNESLRDCLAPLYRGALKRAKKGRKRDKSA